MSQANKDLMRRWFEEVWNQGREEAIDEMMSEDIVVYGLSDEGDKVLRGPGAFKPFHQQFRSAFPGIEVVVEDVITEGDKLAARCSVRGRYEAASLGVEAKQQPTEFTGMVFVRVKDGKFVEVWNNFDFMTMYKQLGAI